MICDVPTQWNSMAEMLQHALQLAPALNILVVNTEYNKTECGVHLQCFCYDFDRFRLYSRDRSQSVSDNAQAYVQGAS